jgi:hypothetical protein
MEGLVMTHVSIRHPRALALIAAAAVCAGLSAPAMAQRSNTHAAQLEPSTASPAPRAERQADQREICVRAEFSNSRVPRRICKTAAEWEAAGGIPGDDD